MGRSWTEVVECNVIRNNRRSLTAFRDDNSFLALWEAARFGMTTVFWGWGFLVVPDEFPARMAPRDGIASLRKRILASKLE